MKKILNSTFNILMGVILSLIFLGILLLGFSAPICCSAEIEQCLEWDANTETDLAGYKVYRSTSSMASCPLTGNLAQTFGIVVEGCDTIDIPDNGTVTYYWRLTAVDNASPLPNESECSEEVSKAYTGKDTVAPGIPTGLQFQ